MVPSLLSDYKKFERIMKRVNPSSNYIDTSNERFLAPTTLIPLLCYAENKDIHKIYVNNNTEDYVVRILNREETSTTIPFINLPKSTNQREQESPVENIVEKMKYNIYGGYGTIYHICNELVNNIYEHTPINEGYANQGYSYAQEYYNEKVLDICVMDDGISIPGKFEKHGIDFIDDCDAISKATHNVSTVKVESDDPNYSRGHGLWTTLKLVVEKNGGSALIVSRNGCLHIQNSKRYKYRLLDNQHIFKGTLIAVRLKNKLVEDYYGTIENNGEIREYVYSPIKRIRQRVIS